MIECLYFIFGLIVDFIKMLFTIDIGHGLSLGLFMCIIFIFLPMVLMIVNFIKVQVIDEVDEQYDLGNLPLGRYVGKHEYAAKHSKQYLKGRDN